MERRIFEDLGKNFSDVMEKLPTPGILAVCGDKNEKENIITLGWVSFGCYWNIPTVTILVRPSRFSYELLKKYGDFTLNVLPSDFSKEISFCGANSGKYCNKFEETGLTKINSQTVNLSSIKEAQIVLECKTIFTSDMNPENLNDIYLAKFYSKEDYHTMFTANILKIVRKD
ncbi:MAG TPA: flavin reductase family protein [Spirochaetota bacterium]|nr:flavin reductase family protein [Spirochaetota bacterium]